MVCAWHFPHDGMPPASMVPGTAVSGALKRLDALESRGAPAAACHADQLALLIDRSLIISRATSGPVHPEIEHAAIERSRPDFADLLRDAIVRRSCDVAPPVGDVDSNVEAVGLMDAEGR